MSERRTHTYASMDYLRRLDILTEDLERHIDENSKRHEEYEDWFKEIKGDVKSIRQIMSEIQAHAPMINDLARERQERAKLLYSVKEKIIGSSAIAILLFILGAVGAAVIEWVKTKL